MTERPKSADHVLLHGLRGDPHDGRDLGVAQGVLATESEDFAAAIGESVERGGDGGAELGGEDSGVRCDGRDAGRGCITRKREEDFRPCCIIADNVVRCVADGGEEIGADGRGGRPGLAIDPDVGENVLDELLGAHGITRDGRRETV